MSRERSRSYFFLKNINQDNYKITLEEKDKIKTSGRPLQIKRAFQNIIDNSLRYSKKIKVSIKSIEEECEIIFDDDGPGIPSKNYEDVFKPFFTLDPSRNKLKGESGLGLSISRDIIRKWIKKVDGFEIDKIKTFDPDKVIERLSQFWLPDENILYIGKAPKRSSGNGIGNRVREYYKTDYGEKRPHAGGHWLKSLTILDELFVYYTACENPGRIEEGMLRFFCNNVSEATISILRDKVLPLPFANLQLRRGQVKNHGLGKMKK